MNSEAEYLTHTLSIYHCTHITAVVDESRHVSIFSSVNDRVMVNPEEIAAAESHRFIPPLPLVSDGLPDHLTDVLDHHLVRSDGFQGKQTPVMDATPAEM